MNRKQTIVLSGLFTTVVVVLVLGYLLFLTPHYAVLYEDIRETEAAEIIAQLDRQGIAYRLDDSGHRVMVPEGDVARARVLVAGSGVAMGGTVGFELFNQSDMGLTEFAQKVNYQRALQGELARTIMTMDGIRFARVHLSLPERTLFSEKQAGPKAAVTVQTQSRRALDGDRVAGIQQLVASAVPDLVTGQVAVLDERGRLLSAMSTTNEPGSGPLTEKEALEEYYRARVQGVVEKLLPGITFRVRILAIGAETNAITADPPIEPAADTDPSSTPVVGTAAPTTPAANGEAGNTEADNTRAADRDFQLRVTIRSEMALNPEDERLLRDAINRAAGLSVARGDFLRFEVGPLQESLQSGVTLSETQRQIDQPPLLPIEPESSIGGHVFGGITASTWLWFSLGGLLLAGILLLRSRGRMSKEEQQSFADLLSENLAMEPETSHGN